MVSSQKKIIQTELITELKSELDKLWSIVLDPCNNLETANLLSDMKDLLNERARVTKTEIDGCILSEIRSTEAVKKYIIMCVKIIDGTSYALSEQINVNQYYKVTKILTSIQTLMKTNPSLITDKMNLLIHQINNIFMAGLENLQEKYIYKENINTKRGYVSLKHLKELKKNEINSIQYKYLEILQQFGKYMLDINQKFIRKLMEYERLMKLIFKSK